jgi:hypothetical protein
MVSCHGPGQASCSTKKLRPQLSLSQKSSSLRSPYLRHPQPQSRSHQPPSHPQRKVLYPHSLDRWPPADPHHYPAPNLCSGPLTLVVLARLICMVCSNKLRGQGNPIRHKNPSNDSKPWIFGKKYCVFKFLDHRDERHSKNGCSALPVAVIISSWKFPSTQLIQPL